MPHDSTPADVVAFPNDLTVQIRLRVREALEMVLEEELASALGATRSQRTATRSGYRNGSVTRDLVTEAGPCTLSLPRGRVVQADGSTKEWRSRLLDRYQRRTRKAESAILGVYAAGGNTRRIRRAIAPLLGEKGQSKSAVSRIIRRLRDHFDAWRRRDLTDLAITYVYLDAMFLPVRLARRVVRVPVLAVIGVQDDGEKVLLTLMIGGSESTTSWKGVVEDLVRRGLRRPALAIVDGNGGLLRALRESWKETKIQRCTRHKLENLMAKAPKHSHGELKRDYNEIIHAESLAAAERARARFVKKWTLLCREVVRSLEEAGDALLTFYGFPKSQWKCLRTTNPLEAVNSAFRRRTKTQGAYPNEDAALVLLYALFATGQITLRKIDGWKDMTKAELIRLQQAA
jgi:transposase-like protein